MLQFQENAWTEEQKDRQTGGPTSTDNSLLVGICFLQKHRFHKSYQCINMKIVLKHYPLNLEGTAV